MTGRMLATLEEVFLQERPDWVLVYGDTNSTLAGSLAGAKLHLPIAHVEAGLRSFNRAMPEEINRVVTDHVSSLLFAPTTTAVENLLREGIPEDRVERVGDVMYDAALYYGDRAERESDILRRLHLDPGEYVLATVHRAENTDSPARLRTIVDGLMLLSRELPVVLPLHPRTRAALDRIGMDFSASGVRLVDPLGYLDMVMTEKHARLVVTDSGGVQKEAYFHGVGCVTLRDETEWTELVEMGWNRLCPVTTPEGIVHTIRSALDSPRLEGHSPYGQGDAARKIALALAAGPISS